MQNSSEPLSPEVERLLSAVPDTIGDTPADESVQAEQVPDAPASDLAVVGVFDPDDVSDGIQLLTGWIADWRDFEAWRLNESKADKLAKPYAQVLNGLWAKYAPMFLAQLSANNPGLMQAAVMSVVVFGPVLKSDLARSKKSAAREMVDGPQRIDEVKPKPSTAKGMVHE